MASPSGTPASESAPATAAPGPVAVVVIGMAGSGKTTFMQRIVSHLYSAPAAPAPYVMNLDPAVATVPFESNVDIRDSVNYREVMKQYNLGPNGGILTSLNLFATKIDQVIGLIENRFGIRPDQSDQPDRPEQAGPEKVGKAEDEPGSDQPRYATAPASATTDPSLPRHLLIDTPGQIEVFTWSASSSILLSALSTSLPTVIAYVIDTPRTAASTATFMANMLYAVSVLYRTGLPMILVLNKADVREPSATEADDAADAAANNDDDDDGEQLPGRRGGNLYGDDGDLVARCVRWMRDWESLADAIHIESTGSSSSSGTSAIQGGLYGSSSYQSSLTNSMSLLLDEFYAALEVVGVSALSGAGVDGFFDAVERKRTEFLADYWPQIVAQRQAAAAERDLRRQREMGKLLRDLSLDEDDRKRLAKDERPRDEPETISDLEDEDDYGDDDDDEDGDGGNYRSAGGAAARNEDGLQSRYQQALDGEQTGNLPSDLSFARYVMGESAKRANK